MRDNTCEVDVVPNWYMQLELQRDGMKTSTIEKQGEKG